MMSATQAWLLLLRSVLDGRAVAPRGKLTRELPQHTIEVDMTMPVVTVPGRKLNYKFMAAEAFWILSGDNSVDGIAPWNKHIAAFSDDGATFFGAYGPPIREQLPFVVGKLLEDEDSRQAVISIWRPSPPKTKDTPCTVAMVFSVRHGKVNAHVFMRSNDVWLGTPYDVFNFSMVAHLVCALLNEAQPMRSAWFTPGTLYLTAASSHIYEHNWLPAKDVLDYAHQAEEQMPTLPLLYTNSTVLLAHLKELRSTSPGDSLRWWEP